MRTIFARKILRLHAAKIGAGNVIKKRFMTFPIGRVKGTHKNRITKKNDENRTIKTEP